MDNNGKTSSRSSSNILGWFLFLPSAVLAFLTPFYFFYIIINLTDHILGWNYYETNTLNLLWICLYLAFFVSLFLFIYTASFVVPSKKTTIRIILSLILSTPLLLYLYIINFIPEAKMSFVSDSELANLNLVIAYGLLGIIIANLATDIKLFNKYSILITILLALGLYAFLFFFGIYRDTSIVIQ